MKLIKLAGYNVLFVPTDSPLATCRVMIGAGASAELSAVPHGTAHYLEHMFFKGTKNRTHEELKHEVALIGESNAWTSHEATCFHINTTGKNLAEAFDILSDQLFLPTFPDVELEKERNVILEERATSQDSPSGVFFESTVAKLQGTEYAHTILGTPETIKQISREDLIKFRELYYTKNNMLFAFAGDLSQLTEEFVESHLSKFETRDGLFNVPFSLSAPTDAWRDFSVTNFEHSSQQALVGIWMKGFSDDDVMNNGWKHSVFFSALGGGMHSLLFNRIRDELGLVYSVSASNNVLIGKNPVSLVFGMLNKDNANKFIDETYTLLEHIAENGIDNTYMDSAYGTALFSAAKAGTSTFGGLGRAMGAFFQYDGDITRNTLEAQLEAMNSMDARSIDCSKYAKEMMSSGCVTTLNV
jgi:predicted Zn-dependent peptidase